MEPPETDMFLAPTPCGSKGMIQVRKSVGWETEQDKYSKLKTRYGNVRTAEGFGTRFGLTSEKGPHRRHEAVTTKPANNYVRTAAENQKEN